jgi:hypothetical protein
MIPVPVGIIIMVEVEDREEGRVWMSVDKANPDSWGDDRPGLLSRAGRGATLLPLTCHGILTVQTDRAGETEAFSFVIHTYIYFFAVDQFSIFNLKSSPDPYFDGLIPIDHDSTSTHLRCISLFPPSCIKC